jgi:hypothetical protein
MKDSIDDAVIEALNYGRPRGVEYYDSDGNLRMPEQDGVPEYKGGGKVMAKGMAKGGKVMSKGYARGGKVMAKGMARGGKVMAKGMANGGRVKAKGMANGGRVMSKGMASGGLMRRSDSRDRTPGSRTF